MTSIQLKYNGRKVLKAWKRRDRWGRFGFGGLKMPTIKVSGKCRLWMQSQLDKEDQKRRTKFRATYKETDHLPAWLLDGGMKDTKATGAVAPKSAWPVELGPTVKLIAEATLILIQAGQPEEALETLQVREVLPDAVREYLKACAHARLGRYRKALARYKIVRATAADFLPAIEGEARMHAKLRNTQKATAIYEDLLKRYPADPGIHVNWALALMRWGRLTAADTLIKSAISRGVDSPDIQQVAGLLQKSKHGPAFRRRFEHKTTHYHIVSDVDLSVCVQAGRNLERMYSMYVKRLARPADIGGDRRFKVYLFAGQDGYLSYYKDLVQRNAAGSAGLYSPLLKQLLIWSTPRRSDMMDTVKHEGFHQFLDRVLPNAPRWFNEGLAVYYESASVKHGRVKLGGFREDCRATLQEHGFVPLDKFFRLDDAAFMKNAPLHYAQSWALIYIMLQSEENVFPKPRDTPDHEEALDAVLAESERAELQVLLKILVSAAR
ncbi:MAG: DUF1570 domain-containing protein [Planctomycetota bacterium]